MTHHRRNRRKSNLSKEIQIMFSRWKYHASLLGLLTIMTLSLSAADSTLPYADALLREATQSFLVIVPLGIENTVEPIFLKQIALRLAEQGKFELFFEHLEKYKEPIKETDKEQPEFPPFRSAPSHYAFLEFVPIVKKHAFEKAEFTELVKLLHYAPRDSTYRKDTYKEILTFLYRENRTDDAEKFYWELSQEDQKLLGDLAELKPQKLRIHDIYQKDEKGQPAPKLYTIFTQFADYHQSHIRDRSLAVFHGREVSDEVWEAVDMVNAKRENEAKALFDKAIEKLEPRRIMMSGTIGSTNSMCQIAAFQIELGKPDWAKETLAKAVAYYEAHERNRTNNRSFYATSALTDIMVALGDMKAARTLIETDEPLHDDLGSPLIHCDLAVAFAKNGDKASATEMLRNVMTVAETLNRPETYLQGLFKAVKRIDDKELCREFIDRTNRIAEKFADEEAHGWSKRRDILIMIVQAQCGIEDFDGAKKIIDKVGYGGETYVKALMTLEKFDLLEPFLREAKIDGAVSVETWRAIAQTKFKDGNQAGAVAAIKSAIHSAKRDRNGYTYGVPVLIVDIALDIKYLYSEQPGRAPMECVNETFRWHRDMLDRKSTKAADYTEEELRHLVRIGGQHNCPETIKEKIHGMDAPVYKLIFDKVRESLTEDGFSGGEYFWLLAHSNANADPKELRELALELHKKLPGYDKVYEVLCKVGKPEDVPLLLEWNDHSWYYVVSAFQAVEKIALPEQLAEVEKAAEKAEWLYFEMVSKLDAEEHAGRTKYWRDQMRPTIDKALNSLRERQ
jgi:hypothetical protein